MKKKRILITGGYGFIGYHLIKKISEKNTYIIDVLDTVKKNRFDRDFKTILKKNNINYICSKFNNLKNISKFDYIIHLAATVGVKNVSQAPFQTLKNNLTDSVEFIERINKKTKIIFFSTSEVYKNLITKKNFSFSEQINIPLKSNIEPRDTYFISKLLVEKIIKLKKNKFLILRPHNFYGPRMGNKHVISEMISKISKKKIIKVKSFNHKRCFCYIDDAINIMTKLIFTEKFYNNVFNIGNPNQEITIFNLIKKIKKIMNKNIILKKIHFEEGSSIRRKPNIDKLEINYNNKIEFTKLDEGLKKTVNWYEKNF